LENGWDPGRRAVGRRKSIELLICVSTWHV
jgi:hypothetical protein